MRTQRFCHAQAEGETFWKLIGLYHCLLRENQGMPNAFIEVLDEAGQHLSHPITGPAGPSASQPARGASGEG